MEITRDVVFQHQPDLHKLEKLLHEIGGEGPIELTSDTKGGVLFVPDVERLLEDGQSVDLRCHMKAGKAGQCHKNSLALLEEDDAYIVMSGFALADNGRWYHHSWCVRDDNGEEVLIETTPEEFVKYFGIEYRGPQGAKRLQEWLAASWPAAPAPNPGGSLEFIQKLLQERTRTPEE